MPVETPAPPPAATETPAAAPPSHAAQSFDQAFPDDGLDTPPETPAKPAAAPPVEKGAAKEPESVAKPPEPTKEKAEPVAAPDHDFTPPQVAKPSELRNWANRMGQRAQKAEGEISKLHSRISQLETQPPKQAEDNSNLAQELAATKKQLEQYENDLRLTKYERSQEYLQQYQKPWHDAAMRAYRDIGELGVFEPNPEDADNPRERQATKADFDEIYNLPLGPAGRLAKQKFGDNAGIVMQHRQNIRQLAEKAYTAVEEYKAKAGEVETQTRAQEAQHEQAMQRMFDSVKEGHAKRSPELFIERDGDTEGNQLLAKGREFASAVFSGNEGLTPQQIAFRDGMAYNRLAAYPRILRDNSRLKAELAEATKTIESLRGSGPGAPPPTGEKKDKGGYKPYDQAFDEAVPA